MTRFTITLCTCWVSLAGIAAAQPPSGLSVGADGKPGSMKTIGGPVKGGVEILPPLPLTMSPGEIQTSREARAHEQYLLQSQAQAESVHRAAMARAEQRTRRLESQRWFGISNTRPLASVDPYNGDYSPGWVSNYPFYPFRWVGGGEPWGFVEGQ
jgi:hypothetical protein